MRRLERRLGLAPVVAISLGTMLGSGLFVLPGLAAGVTGPSMWIAYLLAGLSVVPATLCKAELSTAMATSGGTYVYIERALGPFAGTVAGFGVWFPLLLKSAFALIGVSWYLQEILPVPERATALIALALIVVVNVAGVKKAGKAQLILVVLSVLGLLALALAGGSGTDAALMTPFMPAGFTGVVQATAVVYVSYAGVTGIAAVAEEIKDPDRNLPLAMVASLAIATSLYVLITWLLARNISTHLPFAQGGLIGDYHPLFTLAERLGGPVAGVAIAVLGTLTMVAMANGGLLASSRFPFAMARDRLVPPIFGEVHPRFVTPVTCILLTGAVMAAAILFLDVAKIAKLASSFKIAIFIADNLTVLVLRESSPQWYRPTYRSPLYPVLPLLGIAVGVVLLVLLGVIGVATLAALSVPSVLLWLGYGRRHAHLRKGALQRHGERPDLLAGDRREPSGAFPVAITDRVRVVVVVFDDSPPEPLVELGAALAEGQQVAVYHVTELPEQMELEDIGRTSVIDAALERRARNMAAAIGTPLHYEGLLCRDLRQQVYELVEALSPDWVVFRWQDQGRDAVYLRNPLAWLVSHLPCNVAVFKDAGVRVLNNILVLAEAGPHDRLMAHTADLLADMSGGAITFAAFVSGQAGEHERRAAEHYAKAMMKLVGAPADVQLIEPEERLQTLVALTAGYDLMVLEEPVYQPFYSHFTRSFDDRLIDGARCGVLRLRIPYDPPGNEAVAHQPVPEGEGLLARYLEPELVLADLDVGRKRDLFRAFAQRFQEVHGVEAREVIAALWHREREHNTLIAGGVAMCQATITRADRHHVGLARLAAPIGYHAPDGEAAEVVFFCIGPSPDQHLHEAMWLAGQRILTRVDVAEALREVEDAQGLVDAVRDICRRDDQTPDAG